MAHSMKLTVLMSSFLSPQVLAAAPQEVISIVSCFSSFTVSVFSTSTKLKKELHFLFQKSDIKRIALRFYLIWVQIFLIESVKYHVGRRKKYLTSINYSAGNLSECIYSLHLNKAFLYFI